jgi:membrane protease YdiL (CAAX protease family)
MNFTWIEGPYCCLQWAALSEGRLGIPHEIYYLIILILLSLVIFTIVIRKWAQIPRTSCRYVLFGLLACLAVIPIIFIESLNPAEYAGMNIPQIGLVEMIIRRVLHTLSFASILEEMVFRGIL